MSSTNPSAKTTIFKCDQQAAIVSKKLQSFYEKSEFFDTVLIVGNNRVCIQAHRVVLCAFSDHFLQIFRANKSNQLKGNEVELKEIEASALKLIIDFMYSGSIELSLETVGGILRTAGKLNIKTLVVSCCELIDKNINFSNSLSWFRLAYELNLPTLKAKSLECTYTYFEEISKEEEVLMLSENELMDLLFNDNPHGDFEEDVFLAMAAWINYDKSKRQHLVLRLLSKVRFQVLTPKFIVENRKSVCTSVESYELICSWLQWHLSPETRSNDQQSCTFKPRKKKKKKLAVIKAFTDGQINIETFNAKQNAWSIEIETQVPTKNLYSSDIIVIDSKLIIFRALVNNYCKIIVQCFDLHTSELIDLPPVKKERSILRTAYLNGILCFLGKSIKENSYSMEIYDFSTREWQDVPPLFQPSYDVRTAVTDNMFYLLDLDLGRLQTYDAISNKWTSKAIEKSIVRLYGFAAVEGFLYIIGGLNKGKPLKTVKRFNLSNESWCEMKSLPNARFAVKTRASENKIIISDSCSIDEYDIDTDTWNTLSPLKPDCKDATFHFQYL